MQSTAGVWVVSVESEMDETFVVRAFPTEEEAKQFGDEWQEKSPVPVTCDIDELPFGWPIAG